MRVILIVMFWSSAVFCFGQRTHHINVVVGQPADCVTTSISSPQIDISIFPNPTARHINIDASILINSVTMHDTTGKKLYGVRLNSFQHAIDASNYNPGIYLCIIRFGDQIIKRKVILR